MARKNENVAALLSMYWESVARSPLGPAPPLDGPGPCSVACCHQTGDKSHLRILYEPKMKPIVRPTPPPMRAPILIDIHDCMSLEASWTEGRRTLLCVPNVSSQKMGAFVVARLTFLPDGRLLCAGSLCCHDEKRSGESGRREKCVLLLAGVRHTVTLMARYLPSFPSARQAQISMFARLSACFTG